MLRVTNPVTGALCAEIPAAGPAEVAAAVARARAAQPAWAALPFAERRRLLRRFARRLMSDPDLVPTLVRETGKPRYEAEAIEVHYTAGLIRYYTSGAGRRALRDETRWPFLFPNKRARVVRHPLGVVGVIGPYNWPLLNNFADGVAALVAGNAVVLKPSPLAPLTSLHVASLWREEGMPEDVFQVVAGGNDAGQALVDAVDMVFFTGGHTAGVQVAKRAAERLIPCMLELGGKSPMIVLADADLPRAAVAAVWSSFAHSGEVCVRTERVIVEEPAYDAFVRLCAAEMQRLRLGAPATEDGTAVDIGPLAGAQSVERAARQVEEAIAGGARLVAGGRRRPDLGAQFFEPTLLADVTPNMSVAVEETFAPVMPVLRARDAEEALRLANDSRFGLCGSVWARDPERAAALARRLQAGSVCVNDALVSYFCVEAPLGGTKQSGLGVRHGPEALRQFCRVETILEDMPLLGLLSPRVGREIAFPYKHPILRFLRWFMRRVT